MLCYQVTLIGSDGLQYIFLAKPKDDLRKVGPPFSCHAAHRVTTACPFFWGPGTRALSAMAFFGAALPQDNRMMEAAGVINRLFASDPAARRRNLYLRCVVVMV